jgi:hypothetical protein
VENLAKMEFLSQSPEQYRLAVEQGDTPRRASLEVALRMTPLPKAGDRVRYFIGPKQKGMAAMWQRAFPVESHDALACPYDPGTYLKKLEEWEEKYQDLTVLLQHRL